MRSGAVEEFKVLLAEPGMDLLFRPGDVMRGWTSASITGISILLPESVLA
jgi:hypothetical protein